LVAIGDASVISLRELLRAPSSRSRAAAGTALGRLGRLTLEEIKQLAKDEDPRVRAAVTEALAKLGKPAIAQLVVLLYDSDASVAVEAARGLRDNQEDSSAAIAALIESLPRSHVGWAAAEALASYGVEAQRAVPWIIKAYPLGPAGRFGWDDAAEVALEHIGPPHEVDIPLLCECLSHSDMEARILAADRLAMMGTAASTAAPALELAVRATIEEHLKLRREAESSSVEGEDNGAWRVLVVGDQCALAVWSITRDPERFLALTEQLARGSNYLATFSHPGPWDELPVEALPSIDRLLRDPNPAVRQTALHGIFDFGTKALPLKDIILTLVDDPDLEISKLAISVLAAIGPAVADVTGPRLLAAFRAGTLSLREFASAAGQLEAHSREVREILEQGVTNHDEWAAAACAKSLIAVAEDKREVALLLIQAVGKQNVNGRTAIEILDDFDSMDDLLIPFLQQQLHDPDFWTRRDAIDALAKMGKRGTPVVGDVENLFNDKNDSIRLHAAKAIFLINGHTLKLDDQLRVIFAASDEDSRRERYPAIELIAELKQAGARYLEYVIEETRSRESYFAQNAITTLEAIGTPEAVAALKVTAESKDWILRSEATNAINRLQESRANKE
jgi:HEAT repeat protein